MKAITRILQNARESDPTVAQALLALEVFTPVNDSLASPTGASFIISASDFNGVFAEVPFTMGERGQMHQLNLSQFPGLESTVDPSNPVWQPVPGYVEVLGAGQTVRYPVPHPGTQTRFYRVAIQLTDVAPPFPVEERRLDGRPVSRSSNRGHGDNGLA